MKYIIAIVMMLSAGSASANAVLSCGLPPLKPLGCHGQPQCVCTPSGCFYVWNC
jgi:hypothetical protein